MVNVRSAIMGTHAYASSKRLVPNLTAASRRRGKGVTNYLGKRPVPIPYRLMPVLTYMPSLDYQLLHISSRRQRPALSCFCVWGRCFCPSQDLVYQRPSASCLQVWALEYCPKSHGGIVPNFTAACGSRRSWWSP